MAQTHARIARRLYLSQSAMYAAAGDLIREAALAGTVDDLRRAVDTAAAATGRDRASLIVRAAMTVAGLLPIVAAAA